MTAASKRHMARVAELPCVVCGTSPVQVHHIRMANLTGAGQRCSDWLTMPLCNPDHACKTEMELFIDDCKKYHQYEALECIDRFRARRRECEELKLEVKLQKAKQT